MFSRASFFAFCVLLVLLWAPSYFLLGDINTWQLIITTATTIITFLMVALLQNCETRSDKAVQDKLNAIADALNRMMEEHPSGALTEMLWNSVTQPDSRTANVAEEVGLVVASRRAD